MIYCEKGNCVFSILGNHNVAHHTCTMGKNHSHYTITVIIPAGNTATTMKLSENGDVIKIANITSSTTDQTISHVVASKGGGTYLCELKNAYGTTVSKTLIVMVKGQPSSDEWVPNKAYKTGDMVTYKNKFYKCLQSHTSLVGWELVTSCG